MNVRFYENIPYNKIYGILGGNKKHRIAWFINEFINKQEYFSSYESNDHDRCEFLECNHFWFPNKEADLIMGPDRYKLLSALTTLGILSCVEETNVSNSHRRIKKYRFKIQPGSYIVEQVKDCRILTSFKNLWKLRLDLIRRYGLTSIIKQLSTYEFKITRHEFNTICGLRYPEYIKKKQFLNEPFTSLEEYIKNQDGQWKVICKWNDCTEEERQSSFFKVCRFGTRLHSPFSSLMSELRAYVVDSVGKYLIEFNSIDIKCSQPTLYANILVDRGISCNYVDTVRDEDIHTVIALKNGIERSLAKLYNCTLMFCKPSHHMHKQFCKWYPIAGDEITKDKTTRFEGLPSNKQELHKSVSCMLQQKESEIMRKVWKALYNHKIHFLPVHDAVYVERGYSNNAHDIMTNILNDELNFHSLTVEQIKQKTTGEIL